MSGLDSVLIMMNLVACEIGRENQFGAEWRKNLVHSQHFSRTNKRVISGIQLYAIEYGISEQAAIDRLEHTFKEFNCSLYNFFSFMQDSGHIKKKKLVEANLNQSPTSTVASIKYFFVIKLII